MKRVEFSPPCISEDDITAVVDVLRSGWITSGGVGKKFAQELCSYTQAFHVSILNSATSALFLALKSMGIGSGDQIITTPYTFAATANVIYHTGAEIVFVDTAPDSFYIDPLEIYKKVTPKTKAVIPVDFSTAFEFKLDRSLLRKYFTPNNKFQEALGCPLILVDAAHSLGSRYIDSSIDMAAYSFHAVKNLTTAEGGALMMNSFGSSVLDQEFISLLNAYSLHGQNRSAQDKFTSGTWQYDVAVPGYKCNMPDVLAVLGLSQLKRFESQILSKRRALIWRYMSHFKQSDRFIIDEPSIFQNVDSSSCHLMPLRIRDFSEQQRDQLISYCFQHGVSANVHYKPLTMMGASSYYGFQSHMPHSIKQYQNQISLPLHIQMDFDDVDFVAEVIKKGIK